MDFVKKWGVFGELLWGSFWECRSPLLSLEENLEFENSIKKCLSLCDLVVGIGCPQWTILRREVLLFLACLLFAFKMGCRSIMSSSTVPLPAKFGIMC